MLQFRIVSWAARAPGLADVKDWEAWAQHKKKIDEGAILPAVNNLPMMLSRRLKSGSRLAADVTMSLMRQFEIDAIVFASRHGELERNFAILTSLAHEQDISPTEFTMSVHNAAVGSVSIASKFKLLTTSIAAGLDTFQQALCEVNALLSTGIKRVLIVGFDNAVPTFYHSLLPANAALYPWAVACVLERGNELQCQVKSSSVIPQETLPQAMVFMQSYLNASTSFSIQGEAKSWQWSRMQ